MVYGKTFQIFKLLLAALECVNLGFWKNKLILAAITKLGQYNPAEKHASSARCRPSKRPRHYSTKQLIKVFVLSCKVSVQKFHNFHLTLLN